MCFQINFFFSVCSFIQNAISKVSGSSLNSIQKVSYIFCVLHIYKLLGRLYKHNNKKTGIKLNRVKTKIERKEKILR